MTVRTPFAADVRAAAVTLLTDYAADVGIKLQVYRARPAFDPPADAPSSTRMTEDFGGEDTAGLPPADDSGCDVLVLHGLFD